MQVTRHSFCFNEKSSPGFCFWFSSLLFGKKEIMRVGIFFLNECWVGTINADLKGGLYGFEKVAG